MDYQIWCGPAMASNAWTAGTFLEKPENRRSCNALNLSAAVHPRAQLRTSVQPCRPRHPLAPRPLRID